MNLLKKGTKRRRTKAQIEEAKFAGQEERDNLELAISDNDDLKRELEMMKEQMRQSERAIDFADSMIAQGYVKKNEHGAFVPISEEER